jgi:hypothetical protein
LNDLATPRRIAPSPNFLAPQSVDLIAPLQTAREAATCLLAWPFDAARAQYSAAVRAGILSRSILASRDFERGIGRLERTMLGPFARRV